MEPRQRARRGTAPSGLASPPDTAARLPLANIAALINNGGQLTLGALHPIKCVAVATDDHNCLAMLQRRPDESLQQLLERLDAAIDRAWATDELIDEINPPLPKNKQR